MIREHLSGRVRDKYTSLTKKQKTARAAKARENYHKRKTKILAVVADTDLETPDVAAIESN